MDTVVFSPTKTYNSEQLVELNGSAYVPATSYTAASKAIVLQAGNIYMCITNTTGAFDASKWKLLGAQYDLFYVSLPVAEFDILSLYNVGDFVFWKDKVYKAVQSTPTLDEQTKIQYLQYSNIPQRNIFPDDPNNGVSFWGTGVAYTLSGLLPSNAIGDFTAWSSVTAYVTGNVVSYGGLIYQAQAASTNKTPGTDFTKWAVISWASGDNRNQKMVEVMVDISVYKINKQIAPRNITQSRMDANDIAIQWLDMARKGNVQTDLPVLQPQQGNRIRSGGNVKVQNSY